jgi:hypothetical protein
VSRRVLEGGAAGLLADRLHRLAVVLHGLHLGLDRGQVGGRAENTASVKIRSSGAAE